MQAIADWNDFGLFAAVARAGSLAGAADATGVSSATLSRRMAALERRVGRKLFLHGKAGYAVTGDGRDLLERVGRMETAAAEIARWRETAEGAAPVRISAGTWTSWSLARRLDRYWSREAPWRPMFLRCERDMDIARREIDIGVRNRRPEQPWLAGRRTKRVTYSVYARDAEVTGWIGASDDAALTPSARWIARHHGDAIRSVANEPHLALAMAAAGIGRMVLPDFVGRGRDDVVAVDGPIAELESEEWLVAHHEARHEPPIRAALETLARILTEDPA